MRIKFVLEFKFIFDKILIYVYKWRHISPYEFVLKD